MESWESLIGARMAAHGAVKTCRIEDVDKRRLAFYKKSDKYKAQRKGADKRYREAHKAERNEASRLWRLAHPDYHKNYKPKPKGGTNAGNQALPKGHREHRKQPQAGGGLAHHP